VAHDLVATFAKLQSSFWNWLYLILNE